MPRFPADDDLDGWAKLLADLPEFEIEDDGEGCSSSRQVLLRGDFVGLLASGRFPGRLQVTAFQSEGAEFVAVDLWHGGNNGMVTTVILEVRPRAFNAWAGRLLSCFCFLGCCLSILYKTY